MIEALTLEELNNKVVEKYNHDERRVIGIMIARYTIPLAQEIINSCYEYWDANTGKYMDIFWAGYGEYISPDEVTRRKVILKYPENEKRAYFDLDAFIEIKDQLDEKFNIPYSDKLQLVLVNYRDGMIRFDETVRIDLENNLDVNHSKIREVMEFVWKECRHECEVAPIGRKLKIKEKKEKLKGITFSDIVSTAIGAASLV